MTNSPRPRIQRAFLQWLAGTNLLSVTSLRIKKRTDGYIDLAFTNKTPAIRACLTRWEINVSVEYEGDCWDLLISLEAIPKKIATGYVCRLCHEWSPDNATIYPSREALWIGELFTPFADWVSQVLSKASHIGLYGDPDSGTWAKLITPNTTPEEIKPVHLISITRQ